MADSVIFYTHPMSRGRIVRWMLEEVGHPYETKVVSYGPEMKAPAYRAINPMGKVPALQHGAATITECPAICAYLADAFPAAQLSPAPGMSARGAYFRWLFFAAGPLESAVSFQSLKVEIPPEKQGFLGFGSMDQVLDAIEHALKAGPHLAGEFSAADVYMAGHLGFGLRFGTLEARPAFVEYVERLSARPAAKRAAEIDDALIAGAQQQSS